MFGPPFSFWASGGLVVPLPGGDVFASSFYPESCSASLAVNTDGTLELSATAGWGGETQFWFRGGGPATGAAYEVRATKVDGLTPAGNALGVWLPTSASWVLASRNQGGMVSTTLLIEFRATGGGPVLTSGTYFLEAEMAI